MRAKSDKPRLPGSNFRGVDLGNVGPAPMPSRTGHGRARLRDLRLVRLRWAG